MERHLITLVAVLGISGAVFAGQPPPMLQAQNHLERAHVLLTKPNPPKAERQENAVAAQLTLVATNLEEAKINKGSYLPAAKKAVEDAQAELAKGDDEEHRAKALEFVIKAEEEVKRGWATRQKRR